MVPVNVFPRYRAMYSLVPRPFYKTEKGLIWEPDYAMCHSIEYCTSTVSVDVSAITYVVRRKYVNGNNRP